MKRRSMIALALALTLLAGCGTKPSSSDSSSGNGSSVKDEVVAVLKAEPSNIDPHGNTELVAMTTQVQIFETLVKKNENGEIVPCLAKSWEQIDDTTFQFHLREGVKFHNGDTLTADDVVYTIARACTNPGSSSTFKTFDGEATHAIDELTVEIKLKTPDASIYDTLNSQRGGIVCKRAVEEQGEDAYGRNPVGTGPYKLSDWQSGT